MSPDTLVRAAFLTSFLLLHSGVTRMAPRYGVAARSRLKRLVADLSHDNAMLKDIVGRKW